MLSGEGSGQTRSWGALAGASWPAGRRGRRQAAAEADGIAHVRQTPSYPNVPEQNGLERKCVGPGRIRLLREGRMWTKGNSSAPGTEEQRNFVSLFLEVFEQLMLLLCEVGD